MKTISIWAVVLFIVILSVYFIYHFQAHQIKNVFGNWWTNLKQYKWWELIIFVIGSMSFISILVVLLLPIGNGPADFTNSGVVPSVDSPEFIHMLSESLDLPQRQGEPIEILNNGDAFLTSLLADIDSAHSSINIMVFIWTDGTMSDQVLEHLDKKLKQGVEVRIMYDAFGSPTGLPKQQLKVFKDLGGKIEVFHSFTIVPWQLLKNQIRNHRRAIIIDGNIGYTGGMTVSDSWLGNASNPKEYRDMMFRTTGPMAHDLQGVFNELWTSMTGELLFGETFYPQVLSTQNKSTLTYIPLASIPSPDSLTLQKFVLLSLLGAKQKIYITTPYFLPDLSFRNALIQKAKDGVDVRVLVPNKLNDSQSVYYASHYYYEYLLEAGVKIYEYQPTFIHTKSMVIDGDWSIIGSANMDNRSRKLQEEDIFGVSDKVFGATLENTFLKDLTHAKQIDLTEWKKRSIWQRIREIFDLKFVQQY